MMYDLCLFMIGCIMGWFTYDIIDCLYDKVYKSVEDLDKEK